MTGAGVLDSRYSWARLGITLAIASVGNVGMWAIVVVLPSVQAEFGVGRSAVALPYTLTMLGFALGNLVVGRLLDRHGITAAVTLAAIILGAGFALAGTGTSLLAVAVLHFVIGLGTAASFGPLVADISLWFQRRRGIAVAIAASGNYLSGAIWPWLLVGVLERDGWRSVYLFLAVLVVVVMVPLAQLLRRRVPEEALRLADIAASANAAAADFSPRVLQAILVVAGIACCVAMSMPQVHIVAYCVDLGYGPAVGAEMLSLMLLGGVVSRLVSGLIADQLGGLRTLLIGSGLQAVALFLYLPFDGLVSLYVVSLVFGLSQGGIVPSYALIVREYMPAREAGARVGVVIMATMLGMALGGWLSGVIYDLTGSYAWAFLHGIAWNFLNIGLALLILFRTGTPRAARAA